MDDKNTIKGRLKNANTKRKSWWNLQRVLVKWALEGKGYRAKDDMLAIKFQVGCG